MKSTRPVLNSLAQASLATVAALASACGEAPAAGPSLQADAGASDAATGDLGAQGLDTAGDLLAADANATDDSTPDASAEDSAQAETAAPDATSADATADSPSDSSASDTAPDSAVDTGPSDADVADSAGTADPNCPDCLYTQVPAAPHPGGPGPLALAPAETLDYGSSILDNYKKILVVRPAKAGVYPTILFAHGKQLYEGGGFPAKLGYPYRAFMDQVASHGYVVAMVRVEQGLLDGDHVRMASDLLAASEVLFDKITFANPDKVAYVGHSMGAKVVLLAAWKTLADDTAKQWADPAAVLAFSVSNEPPPVGTFVDARDKLKLIPADAPTWFTLATGDDDSIAPWNDPQKPNAAALYDTLTTAKRQLLVLHGTGKDDPNPQTTPELVDDHSAPLSINGKVGGAADFAMPAGKLDGGDWYGFWKWTVGALNFHFAGGDPKWAYGAMREHGGLTATGQVIKHQVVKQGWTALPQP